MKEPLTLLGKIISYIYGIQTVLLYISNGSPLGFALCSDSTSQDLCLYLTQAVSVFYDSVYKP